MRETKNLEFKEKYTKTFLKTVSAFANYRTGEIKFGVKNNGTIIGIEDPIAMSLNIENAINDNIQPTPNYEINIDSKLNVITLKVYEGSNKPYLYQSKAYIRNDSSTVETDRLELSRLILDGQNQSFDVLPTNKKNLKFDYLESKLKERLKIHKLTTDILITLGLYIKDEGYTNAGELLSDNNTLRGIDIVRFGENINIFLDRTQLDNTSILQQYDLSVEKFKQYYIFEEIVGSTREKKELIPEESFREVIANALVHRTWDVNSQIKVEMHDDRIEIISPGGLPKGLSKEEYLSGHISVLRNPIIADIFFRLNIIEKFGTGIQRIFESYITSKAKPQFEFYENSIKVVLPKIELNFPNVSKDQSEVYKTIENAALSSSEISKITGFGKTKTVELLHYLLENGYIEKRGKARGTKYKARKFR